MNNSWILTCSPYKVTWMGLFIKSSIPALSFGVKNITQAMHMRRGGNERRQSKIFAHRAETERPQSLNKPLFMTSGCFNHTTTLRNQSYTIIKRNVTNIMQPIKTPPYMTYVFFFSFSGHAKDCQEENALIEKIAYIWCLSSTTRKKISRESETGIFISCSSSWNV